jgi:alkanesulfonate monooxygenase SsuD/methylene tetrahydromethanopterin reductase-like flavin-dependent oxidoreductase (luciferase family)
MGHATGRIELGTAVVPIQTRHPIAMAQAALSNQAVCEGRFTLGLGTSHHWIIEDMLGLRYERPARDAQLPAGPERGPARPGSVDVENDGYRVHSPMDVTDWGPIRCCSRPSARSCCASLARRLGDDPVDGRRACRRGARRPAHHEGRAEAGRPAPRVIVGVPIAICPTTTWTRHGRTRTGARQAEYSPNYQRLLARGDATNVGRILARGDESAVVARLRAFRDAGATDLAVRVLRSDPIVRHASSHGKRTLAFAAALCPEL